MILAELLPDQEANVAATLAGMASSRQVSHPSSRNSSPVNDSEHEGHVSDEEEQAEREEGDDDDVEGSE